ncbi:hypothetical protein DM02DRAFT_175458 [Periconia macrospinosa]|uniref:Uncharacterized protein n=1 Tax=Periconia macrospinosa TaxID=97972 RepID=A0A2V1DA14_9PLEO|nr:hypothetical protein DM02DRAFT_175458 [Periconia macrospinosa]
MSSHPVPHQARDSGRERVAPPGPSRYNQSIISQIQRRLDEASLVQEELGNLRESLLVEREKVRSSSNQLRIQRVKAGDAEANFMNLLRKFFNERREDFPPELNAAYNVVQEARDNLGVMEEDYLQAERTLSGSEWTFMEKEGDVYQFELHELFSNLHLIDNPTGNGSRLPSSQYPVSPVPEPTIVARNPEEEYEMAKAELESLREKFSNLREEQSSRINVLKLPKVDLEAISDANILPDEDLLWKLVASEVKVQKLKQLIVPRDEIPVLLDRRMSDPLNSRSPGPEPIPLDDRATVHTESAVQTLSNDPATQQKTMEWLLDCLSSNAIQRTIEQANEVADKDTSPYSSSDKNWHFSMDCAGRRSPGTYDEPILTPATQDETGDVESHRKQSISSPMNEQSISFPMMQPAETLRGFTVHVSPTFSSNSIYEGSEYGLLDTILEPSQSSIVPVDNLQLLQLPGHHKKASSVGDGNPRQVTCSSDTRSYNLAPYQQSNLSTKFNILHKKLSNVATRNTQSDTHPHTHLSIGTDYFSSRRSRSEHSSPVERRHIRNYSTPVI